MEITAQLLLFRERWYQGDWLQRARWRVNFRPKLEDALISAKLSPPCGSELLEHYEGNCRSHRCQRTRVLAVR